MGSEGLIAQTRTEHDLERLEELADEINRHPDVAAIEPLLSRLIEERVRLDDDCFSAVCDALVALGVMTTRGNLNYEFRPCSKMASSTNDAIRRFTPYPPIAYSLIARLGRAGHKASNELDLENLGSLQ